VTHVFVGGRGLSIKRTAAATGPSDKASASLY